MIDSKLESQLKNPAKDLFANLNIKCKSGQSIKYYCCNRNCWEDSILCQKQKCTCQIIHQKCAQLLKAHIVHQQLNKKVSNQKIPLMVEMIDKSVSKIIDKVSEMKDQLENKLNFFGLNKIQYEIVQSIQNEFKVQNIENQSLSKEYILSSFMNKYVSSHEQVEKQWFEHSFNRYKDIIASYKSKINFFFEQIQNTIAAFHTQRDNYFQLHKGFVTSKIYPDPIQAVRINSPHLPQLKYLQSKMKYLIEPITSVRQIFSFRKATQTFDSKKFLESLQGKSRLLFLIEKSQQKRIGFYIPLEISSFINEKVYLSNSKDHNSFIFNLDQKVGQYLNSKSYFMYNKENELFALKKFNGDTQEFSNTKSHDITPAQNRLFGRTPESQTNVGLLQNKANTSSNKQSIFANSLFGKNQETNTIPPQQSVSIGLFGVSTLNRNSNQSTTSSLVSGFVLKFEQNILLANIYFSNESGNKLTANGQLTIGQTDNVVNMEVYAFNEEIFDDRKIPDQDQQGNQREEIKEYQ